MFSKLFWLTGYSQPSHSASSNDNNSIEYRRSTQSVLEELAAYDPINSSTRLAHSCYLKMIGVPNKKIEVILYTDKEITEHILEQIVFATTEQDLIKQRSNDLVFEDNFNEKVLEMARKGRFTYDKLYQVCSKYDSKDGMRQHKQRCEETYEYFTKQGFSKEDAKSNVLAIAFYTGSKSETINRASSLIARHGNGKMLEQKVQGDIDDAAIILYYLVRGLSSIPFYWGKVTRACDLTTDELECYKRGCLVSWLQFSSSKKGDTPVGHFLKRNTFFFIYSLTGRPIRAFSNFKDEDEILFLPHSTFIVVDHQINNPGAKHCIYMRQVELGFTQWSILWVDDHIFDENWENKRHMEKAASRALNNNVHFMPKSNTENAVSFLKSPFGQRLKNRDNFRIVTDMNRTNEHPANTAGARLIKHVRELGFCNKCLVFTSSEDTAHTELKTILSKSQNVDVSVTISADSLRKFINFQD